MLIVTTETNFG